MSKHTQIAALFLMMTAGAGSAGAQKITASAAVRGPVTVRVSAVSGDIDVRAGAAGKVSVTVKDSPARSVSLVSRAKGELQVMFGNAKALRTGKVQLELPKGSTPVVTSISGDVRIIGVGGSARIRVTSGDLTIETVKDLDVVSISGDVDVRRASGAVRVRTISGDVDVETTNQPASRLDFKSTSGSLNWRGRCGKGCSIQIQTLSGDNRLRLDPASSFNVEFNAFSGVLRDRIKMVVLRSKRTRHGGGMMEARYQGGAGSIRARTFSGDVVIAKH